jgi:hypothetical protein
LHININKTKGTRVNTSNTQKFRLEETEIAHGKPQLLGGSQVADSEWPIVYGLAANKGNPNKQPQTEAAVLTDHGGGEWWRVHLNKSHRVDDGTVTWRVSTATK